jgi:hypothetical protein
VFARSTILTSQPYVIIPNTSSLFSRLVINCHCPNCYGQPAPRHRPHCKFRSGTLKNLCLLSMIFTQMVKLPSCTARRATACM